MTYTRPARADDVDYIADLSARVQAKLTAAGSLQQIGPIDRGAVADYVLVGAAHVLDDEDDERLGSVFVREVTPDSFEQFATWEFDKLAAPVYFLSKLMIEPAQQGHGLGASLLQGAVEAFARHKQGTLTLDCWAGNDKLRTFYVNNGFELYGIYPEDDFQVAVYFRLPA